jgi:hypothetical protein
MGQHRLMRALKAPMDKAAEYKNRAKECRRKAERANGTSKEQWLELAKEWERLSQQAEQYPDLFP